MDAVHVIDHVLLLANEVADDLGQLRRRKAVANAHALGEIVQDGVVKLDALGIALQPTCVVRLEDRRQT